MKFYKICNSNKITAAPSFLRSNTSIISNPTEKEYNDNGYYRMQKDIAEAKPDEFISSKTYSLVDNVIIETAHFNKINKRDRSFSKRLLMDAFKRRGMWDDIKAWIESSEFNDYWYLSTTLDEFDPYMQNAIAQLESKFSLRHEDINAILSESIVRSRK